jgi:hypothetical protein
VGSEMCIRDRFYINHDFYFYTYKDYIEVRKGFKGTMSVNLLGKSEEEVMRSMGRKPDYREGKSLFYSSDLGVIELQLGTGGVSEIRSWAK